MSKSGTADIRVSCVALMQEMLTRGGSLTRLLPEAQQRVPESERAQLQAWSYGFARFHGELGGLVDLLIDKPVKAKDLDVYLLMQLGIFQLRHTTIAPHAAVDETVKVLKRLKKPWARGLVNAVLRNYQRRKPELEGRLKEPEKLNHPVWLLERFKRDWPQQWQAVCQANNQQGPMTLRVNTQRQSVETYRDHLTHAGLDSSLVADAKQAVQLSEPVAVTVLPGFAKGDASVQDAAAQLAGIQLIKYAASGGRVLDACAAPGGKTAHLLEMGHFDSVLALDKDAERLQRVTDTLKRLSLTSHAKLIAADATDVPAWWDGVEFNAILLDAPCSGTGVIRRHPDIKLLRRESDIEALATLQGALLDALWSTLSHGGVLLYATCSILKQENEQQVQAFLERTPDATLAADMRQILPGENDMDGFFYAPLIKRQQ